MSDQLHPDTGWENYIASWYGEGHSLLSMCLSSIDVHVAPKQDCCPHERGIEHTIGAKCMSYLLVPETDTNVR